MLIPILKNKYKMSSSQTSKYSSQTGHNLTSSTLAVTPPRKPLPQPNDDVMSNELALETFINNIQLHTFFKLSEDEQNERLTKIDVLELFQAVQNVYHEFAMAKLENHFLIDFLEKNDPKLLIGLEKRRATTFSVQAIALKTSSKSSCTSMADGGRSSSVGYRSKSSMTKSILNSMSLNTAGSQKKLVNEYKLNFRAKTEMAEKLANEIEKRVREKQKNGK